MSLALGIHLLVLLPAILAPHLGFWQRQRPPVDIQTVSLFSVAELATPAAIPPPGPAAPETPAPAPPEPVETAEPTPPPAEPSQEDAIVLPPASPEPVPAPRAEPHTIAPSQPVKVAAPPAPPPEPLSTRPLRTRSDDEQLRHLREYYQLEARAREAGQEAEAARSRALEGVRADIRAQAAPPRSEPAPSPLTGSAPEPTGNGDTPRAGDAGVDAATREYLVRLNQHLEAYWSLPNLPSWDENLLAIIVITVTRDGMVRDTTFEYRAENRYFNQLVQKTVEDAIPLPSFPAALRQNEMEIGLRFRPGEVF